MTMDGMGYDLAINMHLQEVPMSSNRGKEEFQKTRRLRNSIKEKHQNAPWDEQYLCLHVLVMFMVKLVGKW